MPDPDLTAQLLAAMAGTAPPPPQALRQLMSSHQPGPRPQGPPPPQGPPQGPPLPPAVPTDPLARYAMAVEQQAALQRQDRATRRSPTGDIELPAEGQDAPEPEGLQEIIETLLALWRARRQGLE
jgi:hypothetical protein